MDAAWCRARSSCPAAHSGAGRSRRGATRAASSSRPRGRWSRHRRRQHPGLKVVREDAFFDPPLASVPDLPGPAPQHPRPRDLRGSRSVARHPARRAALPARPRVLPAATARGGVHRLLFRALAADRAVPGGLRDPTDDLPGCQRCSGERSPSSSATRRTSPRCSAPAWRPCTPRSGSRRARSASRTGRRCGSWRHPPGRAQGCPRSLMNDFVSMQKDVGLISVLGDRRGPQRTAAGRRGCSTSRPTSSPDSSS